jgi:N-acetylglucosamine-6-phosphate deacetylase
MTLCPSYIDLQVNGYVGVDFNDPEVEQEALQRADGAMQRDGVEAALPTVITDSAERMEACIRGLKDVIQARDGEGCLRGIHLEGPFLSPKPGFIGAHPVEHARGQDLLLLERLLDAADGQVRLVTLDPAVDVDARMTRLCVERGILVAAGHTDANIDELAATVEAGLSMFTHFGNACPQKIDRHDNILYRALSLRDKLAFTVIADGHHVPALLFRLLVEFIEGEKLIVVSDAISAAGLGEGVFQLGRKQVRVGEDRVARDPSGENFAGSAARMRDADVWLDETIKLGPSVRRKLLHMNAARLLGLAN